MKLYLLAAGLGTLLFFGLPILITPLRWARALRWEVPEDVRLVRYFARSLGSAAVAIGGVAVYLALAGGPARPVVLIGVVATALLTVIHVVGALERSQPWTETVEIPMWAGLTVWGLLVYLL